MGGNETGMNVIQFTLNGEVTKYDGNASARALDVLREHYGLTGVKCGCKEGECGACSILLDGQLVNSCMLAMGRLHGSNVVTIEGFRETEAFRILSKAYSENGAVQCGYCTPGMILASYCILKQHAHPTKDEIRTGISGNLCRCTGYQAIVRAIQTAAEEGEGVW